MKIDFDGHKMVISFDKVPRFLYFNEEGSGCGAVFLDGQRVKLLSSVRMEAYTKNDGINPPLKYSIVHCNGERQPMEETFGNMQPDVQVGIKLLDTDIFKAIIEVMKQYATDSRIPNFICKEYIGKIKEALKSE